MQSNANETQVGGTHYAGKVQHWDYVNGALRGRYFEGNITKYVTRHEKKNGRQDVQKAVHYTEKLYELYKQRATLPMRPMGDANFPHMLTAFLDDAKLGELEERIVIQATLWSDEVQLLELVAMVKQLLARYDGPVVETPACDPVGDKGAGEPGPQYTNQG